MNFNCEEKSNELYLRGEINEFARDFLLTKCSEGLDESLWEETVGFLKETSAYGVSNEKEFELYFYIDQFTDDLVEEIVGIKIDKQTEEKIKKYIYSLRNVINFDDLVSFRIAILKWIKDNGQDVKKTAYPNRWHGNNYQLEHYDMSKWVGLVNMINKASAFGVPKDVALNDAANQLEMEEKFNFLSWYNFKFGDGQNLYNINKIIKEKSAGRYSMINSKFATMFEDKNSYYIPKFDYFGTDMEKKHTPPPKILEQQKIEDFESARSKMISRTFAIDKLLEKYKNVFDTDQLEAIEDALNALRKKIRKLKLASTVNDCLIKTSNILIKVGFVEGAKVLENILTPESKAIIEKKAFSDSDIKELEDVIHKLFEINNMIKRRDVVRNIAEVDLKLYDMDLAGFFPELNEAQSKLMEAFGYANNKLESVIPKLQTSLASKQQQQQIIPVEKKRPPLKQQDLSKQVSELAKEIEKDEDNL